MYSEATDAGPTVESSPAEDASTEMADSPQHKSQDQQQREKDASPAKYVLCTIQHHYVHAGF